MDIKKLAEKFGVSSEDVLFSAAAVCLCIFIVIAIIVSAALVR